MFHRLLAARDIIQLLGPFLGHAPVISTPGSLPSRDGIFPLKQETRYSYFSFRTFFLISFHLFDHFLMHIFFLYNQCAKLIGSIQLYGYKLYYWSKYFCAVLHNFQITVVYTTSFHPHSLLHVTQVIKCARHEAFRSQLPQGGRACSLWNTFCHSALWLGLNDIMCINVLCKL